MIWLRIYKREMSTIYLNILIFNFRIFFSRDWVLEQHNASQLLVYFGGEDAREV